jgi:hypothetical protein
MRLAVSSTIAFTFTLGAVFTAPAAGDKKS